MPWSNMKQPDCYTYPIYVLDFLYNKTPHSGTTKFKEEEKKNNLIIEEIQYINNIKIVEID